MKANSVCKMSSSAENQILTRKNMSVKKVLTRAFTAHPGADKTNPFSVIHSTFLFTSLSTKGGQSHLYVFKCF